MQKLCCVRTRQHLCQFGLFRHNFTTVSPPILNHFWWELYQFSTKQKINTRSSTEAELVGVNDAMGLVLWTCLFLDAQGYGIDDNIVYQDNESTMLLANNGRSSSTKNTRHIDVRYWIRSIRNGFGLNTVLPPPC